MGLESKAILATTVLVQDGEPYQQIRSELVLKTLSAARLYNYSAVVIDGGSPADFIQQMRSLDALVIPQELSGMGNARRQALKTAQDISGRTASPIIWTEPEKATLVPLLGEATNKIAEDSYEMVMFRRRSLASYPPEQIHVYQMGSLLMKYLTNLDTDFFFGPVALSQTAVNYFLNYQSQFGDLWDSIHVPKLQIIEAGLTWTQVDIDYNQPREQTDIEQGNINLFLRRTEQINQLTQALTAEARKTRRVLVFAVNNPTNLVAGVGIEPTTSSL